MNGPSHRRLTQNLGGWQLQDVKFIRTFAFWALMLVVVRGALASVDWSDQKSVLQTLHTLRAEYPGDEGPAVNLLQKEINRRLTLLGELKLNLMGDKKLTFDHPYVRELRFIALNDEQLVVRAETLRTLQAIAFKDLSEDSSERLKAVRANSSISHLTEVQVLELMMGEIHDRLGIYRPSDEAEAKIDSPVLW